MPIYIYDIKVKNKKAYNRIKRMFYYYLNQILSSEIKIKTKSTLVVPKNLESVFDDFFRRWEGKIEVYKIAGETLSRFI